MLLTIATTHQPATDLGFLLHKNPARVQSFPLAIGQAHVFYTEATDARCTAVLLLDVDPVGLARGKPGTAAGALQPYVNDRPYVASSFLSVAMSQVYGSALAGRSKDRPELVETPLPLVARLAVLPCRPGGAAGWSAAAGEDTLRRLFAPLGYEVDARRHALDPQFPEWGESPYFTVELRATVRLRDLLSHLYVLVPVLDDEKHYWVGDAEVEKLLRFGAGWLPAHPERELIARRYLKHQGGLARVALLRLTEEDAPDPNAAGDAHAAEEIAVERRIGLDVQRLAAVTAAMRDTGARRVLDLGCGEGKLLAALLADPVFEQIVGVDASHRALEMAGIRLRLDDLPPRQRERVQLVHGALTYRDRRLEGFDAAAAVEVVEHLDPGRLAAFERALFGCARPGAVVLTTPNREYNARFEGLPAGSLRHRDHRFEWTRDELRRWAEAVGERFGYALRSAPIGPDDPILGPPTQMIVFTRRDAAGRDSPPRSGPPRGDDASHLA